MSHPSFRPFSQAAASDRSPKWSYAGDFRDFADEDAVLPDPLLIEMLSQAMAAGSVPSSYDLLALMPSVYRREPAVPRSPARPGWLERLRRALKQTRARTA